MINNIFKLGILWKLQLLWFLTAGHTVRIPFLFVHIGVDAVWIIEDHVVIQGIAAGRGKFEDLCCAGGSNDGISGGYSRYYVFNHTLKININEQFLNQGV